MTEILILIQRTVGRDDQGDPVIQETPRVVLCGVRSIGQQEFYQANATDFHPELKLVLADYLDYQDEQLVDYNSRRYRVIRTYRTGQELELIVERAPVEDGGLNG
jgi:SPP1 family predicted phage head-tail adaptor